MQHCATVNGATTAINRATSKSATANSEALKWCNIKSATLNSAT